MTARISIGQAISLGLVGRAAAPPRPVTGSATPAARAIAAALGRPRRRAHKGGRHVRADGPPTDEVSFRVDHEPRTKQRARTQMPRRAVESAFHEARGSADRFRALLAAIPHGSYTPKETEAFERLVGETARMAMRGREPFAGPVELDILFTFEGQPGHWPTDVTDADLDNAVKAILDGLNGVAFRDDRLVVRKRAEKRCAAAPSIDVVVRHLPYVARR